MGIAVLAVGSVCLSHRARASIASDDARIAMENGHYEYAFSLWRRAVGRNPHDRKALEGLTLLRKIAGQLYEEALMVQVLAPEQAKERLRTVVLMTDPWSEINRESREMLGDDF